MPTLLQLELFCTLNLHGNYMTTHVLHVCLLELTLLRVRFSLHPEVEVGLHHLCKMDVTIHSDIFCRIEYRSPSLEYYSRKSWKCKISLYNITHLLLISTVNCYDFLFFSFYCVLVLFCNILLPFNLIFLQQMNE